MVRSLMVWATANDCGMGQCDSVRFGLFILRQSMINLADFDELNNAMRDQLELSAYTDADGKKRFSMTPTEICDAVLDYLIFAYVMGVDSANEDLGTDIGVDNEEMSESIYRKVADKDFVDRVTEYAEDGDTESILRVVDTDMHYNAARAAENTARRGGATQKTWQTMEDDRVRDPHWWLQGVTVGLDEVFWTDGDYARYPGDFHRADLVVNCRCFLKYT